MPELPEVQTVVDFIEPQLAGRRVSGAGVYDGFIKLLGGLTLKQLNKQIADKTIISVSRRAKYIVLHLDRGYLTFHLRMTGQMAFGQEPPKHTRLTLKLQGAESMHFVDMRKFGTVRYTETLDYLEDKVGIEPLSADFNLKFLRNLLSGRATKAKAFLLNQKFIAGLGNIYVDEALWFAGVHPETPVAEISEPQLKKLLMGIKKVLTESIAHQGTTIINFYYAEGKTGNFKNKLKVFAKTGTPCQRCKTDIIKFRAAGRGTHICPNCQRVGEA